MADMEMNRYLTLFQQIFAVFCVLIAEICILLFFSILTSKLSQLLIEACCHFAPPTTSINTNQFQREFNSNVAIRTQKLASYSKLFAKLTNLFKLFQGRNQKRTGAWPIPFFLNPSPVFPQGLHRAITQRTVR
jgi:hypothetical protein